MKNLFATLALGAALAGCATPYAPQDFAFSRAELEKLPNLLSGMVESVQHVPLDIHGFREAMVHSVHPERVDRLVIRLDDGSAVTLLEKGMQRFAPGQRVRIVSDGAVAAAEHE